MDHKVSKDMISSGMIPSGEKTQADLGRIQYGSAPSPSSLMNAYKSIYEHHQKDKDGNTIPHEGEELNETLMGAVAKGLRGASKVSKNLATSAAKADKSIKAQGGLKNIAQKKLQSAKTKLAPTSGQKQALLGRTTAGKITRGVAALGAANIAGRMASGNGNGGNNRGLVPTKGFSSYDINFGYTPEGDTLSEDLFDALKSALIEEGCDEKNVMKIMASVTPDLINEIIEEENLDEVVFTGGAMLAGLAAKKLLGAAAAKGLKAGATALAKKAAVKTMGMGSRGVLKTIAKKGVGAGMDKAAGTAIKGGLKSAVKNPINTVVAGSMVMPQGQPKPEVAQRAVGTGRRSAGVRTMSLDLFDVVKGKLLDEGLTEEESNDVMTTLTLEEINEVIQLDEISSKLLMKSAKAAEVARGKAAVAGNKQLAIKKLKQGSKFFEKGVEKRRAEGKMGAGYREGV